MAHKDRLDRLAQELRIAEKGLLLAFRRGRRQRVDEALRSASEAFTALHRSGISTEAAAQAAGRIADNIVNPK